MLRLDVDWRCATPTRRYFIGWRISIVRCAASEGRLGSKGRNNRMQTYAYGTGYEPVESSTQTLAPPMSAVLVPIHEYCSIFE